MLRALSRGLHNLCSLIRLLWRANRLNKHSLRCKQIQVAPHTLISRVENHRHSISMPSHTRINGVFDAMRF